MVRNEILFCLNKYNILKQKKTRRSMKSCGFVNKLRGSETILFFWFLLIQFKQYLYCFALFKLTFQALRTVSYRSLSLSSKTDWLIFIIMYLKTGSIYSCLDKELCNTSVFIMPLSCLQIQRRTDKKKDLARDLLLCLERVLNQC